MRKKVTCCIAIGALTLVAACASPRERAAKSNPSASAYATMSVSELAAKAASEGQVISYNSTPSATSDKITATFAKSYPKMSGKSVRLDSASIPPRVFVEQRAGKFLGDIAGADGVYMNELRLGGATEPYSPPADFPLPQGLNLPAGYRTVDSVETIVAAWNPKILKQHHVSAPKTWYDFTKPEWKGHFSVDPDGLNWYLGLIAEYGHDKAHALIKQIGDNAPIPVQSHSQALVQLESGQAWATATSYGYLAAKFAKEDPEHVAFESFNPLITTPNMTYVLRNAPHPAAARLYINWSLSREGQQAQVDVVGLQSLRTDVKQDPNVWDPTRFKPVFANPNLTLAQVTAYRKEFRPALHVAS